MPTPSPDPPTGPGSRAPGSRRGWVAAWIFGLLCFFAFVAAVLHFGELAQFAALAETAHPGWLLVALATQVATYGSEAAVWHAATRRAGHSEAWLSLVPLSLAKLFTDQAMPSGGIGGAILMMEGLCGRGMPRSKAMAVMLVAMVSAYAAYVTATLGGLVVLAVYHRAGPAALGATAALTLIAVSIPASVLLLRHWRDRLRGLPFLRFPGLAGLFEALVEAPTDLLRDPVLLLRAWAFQLTNFFLDALTLWLIFRALGAHPGYWVAYSGVMTASAAATLAPVPGGLGAFEAGSVAMLTILGLPLETAFAGTLLLRGLTFWLPMLPGIWLARREISGAARH